jgi:hypothetical protein
MPRYFFLYQNEFVTRGSVFQADHVADTESEVREYFKGHYNAEIVAIRKGDAFSKKEIDEKKKALRYGK